MDVKRPWAKHRTDSRTAVLQYAFKRSMITCPAVHIPDAQLAAFFIDPRAKWSTVECYFFSYKHFCSTEKTQYKVFHSPFTGWAQTQADRWRFLYSSDPKILSPNWVIGALYGRPKAGPRPKAAAKRRSSISIFLISAKKTKKSDFEALNGRKTKFENFKKFQILKLKLIQFLKN